MSTMIDLNNRVHLFAHSSEREPLNALLTGVLGLPVAASHDAPGYDEPVLAYRFANGASLSVEFTRPAPHDGEAFRGTWLELLAADPDAVKRRVLDAGLPRVPFAGNDEFYFAAPGGQVFRVVGR